MPKAIKAKRAKAVDAGPDAPENKPKLTPLVVSTPRSGLNFLRTCIEGLTGRHTPGKQLLVEPAEDQPPTFRRTHDVGGHRGKSEQGAWGSYDNRRVRGRTVVILIRDPLEVFARQKKVRGGAHPERMLKLYMSNLNTFAAFREGTRAAFYYEDIVRRPEAMATLISFLGIHGADGLPIPTEVLQKEWERLQALGRELYDRNQAEAGGSMSKTDPENLKVHQQALDPEETEVAVRALRADLTVAAKALLARYELALV